MRSLVGGSAAFASIGSRHFPLLVALFVGVMLISNVTGTKGVVLFDDWLNLDLGQQGLGSASCGPALPDRYRVAPEPASFGFVLSTR